MRSGLEARGVSGVVVSVDAAFVSSGVVFCIKAFVGWVRSGEKHAPEKSAEIVAWTQGSECVFGAVFIQYNGLGCERSLLLSDLPRDLPE